MELSAYASSLTGRTERSTTLDEWVLEARSMVVRHALRLVPHEATLDQGEREALVELLAEALEAVDPNIPVVVPVSIRERLLTMGDERLTSAAEVKTVLAGGL